MRRSFIFLISLVFSLGFANEGQYSDCSLEDKIPKSNTRYKTFRYALNLMQERHAQILVETGTSRMGRSNCIGDGCSTLIFAEWASQNDAFLYSVDICKECLLNAEKALGDLVDFVQFVHSDSVEFLKNFGQPIDFLYLDSYDFEVKNPRPSQQHHLNEIIAAYPWLTKNSIVMIDDCALPHGGKGKLVIEYLLKRNWKIVSKGYQVVLVPGK